MMIDAITSQQQRLPNEKVVVHYDSYYGCLSQGVVKEQVEEIPTIVLQPESAIHTVDMFLEGGNSISNLSSSSSSDFSSASDSSIRVVNADYNAVSQTLLYGFDESRTRKCRKRGRAAYISATVIKESTDAKLGMGIQKVNGSLLVSSLRAGCLLSNSPFQVGDKIISINNHLCAKMSVSAAAKLLKEVTGPLTVIVENPNGDPKLVECMVMKTAQDSKVGLGVALATARQLLVSSIHPKGIFAESLLNRRDRIVSINNTVIDYLVDATDAASIITAAEHTVTVVAERRADSAAVVALE